MGKKITVSLGLWLFGFFAANAGTVTNTTSLQTNLISICLISDPVMEDSHISASVSQPTFQWIHDPILSDKDFVSWDSKEHTFVITPQAGIRLLENRPAALESSFVLMCSGEPIYYGQFKSVISSASSSEPVIMTDNILGDCFGGSKNVPEEIWKAIRARDPKLTDRVLALTNKMTNVTLTINRGYPTDDFGEGPDLRNDPRIISAVEKLFGKKQPLDFQKTEHLEDVPLKVPPLR